MSLPPTTRGIVFDAYGTLFNVYAVETCANEMFPGLGSSIATLWRDKQIEYSRVRTLSDRYASFWDVTTDALDYTLARLVGVNEESCRKRLLAIYRELPAHPEVKKVLNDLKQAGFTLAVLSNADSRMLADAVNSAGLDGSFLHLLSVDTVRRFKTAPEAYALAPTAFGCNAEDLVFVSSNGWDIVGASWFGFCTFWVNRQAAPAERLGRTPDGEGSTLHDLDRFMQASRPAPAAV